MKPALRVIFMTGATGFVGGELLRRLLEWEPDTEAYVLVRAVDDDTAALRGEALLKSLFAAADLRADAARRLHVVRGDVTAPMLGLSPQAVDEIIERTTDYFNFACDVRFDLPLAEALAVSIGGATGIHALARAGRHARLHHCSTYAVGRPASGSDRVYETPPDRSYANYHNTYEEAKAAAELYLIDRASEVQLAIYRPSIVVGHSRTGWTQDFKVVYKFLRAYAMGLLPPDMPLWVERGSRSDQLHIDVVADSLYLLSARERFATGTIHAIVAGDDACVSGLTMHVGMEGIRLSTLQHEGRVLAPAHIVEVDRISEDMFVQADDRPAVLTVIKDAKPYFFASHWIHDDSNTRAALNGAGPGRRETIDTPRRLADFCVRTRWGRYPEERPALGARPPMPQLQPQSRPQLPLQLDPQMQSRLQHQEP